MFVSSQGLVGDIWTSDINEDISLDCSLVGEELQLRLGSPIPRSHIDAPGESSRRSK